MVPALDGTSGIPDALDILSGNLKRRADTAPAPTALGREDVVAADATRPVDVAASKPPAGPAGPPATEGAATGAPAGADPAKLAAEQAKAEIAAEGDSYAGAVQDFSETAKYLSPGLWLAKEVWPMGQLSAEESAAQQQEQLDEIDLHKRKLAAKRAQHEAMRAADLNLGLSEIGEQAFRDPDLRSFTDTQDAMRAAMAAKREATAKEHPPELTWWRHIAENFVSAGAMTGLQAVEATYILDDMLLNGGETSAGREKMQKMYATVAQLFPGDANKNMSFISEVARGGGSMIAFLTGVFALKALGVPGAVGAGVLGAATGATTQFRDAEQHDASALQKWGSLLIGSGLGLTEAIQIDRMMLRAMRTHGNVAKILAATPANSLEEFTQEFAQSIGQDAYAKLSYDAKRELDIEGYARQAAAAGIVAGGVGAAVSGIGLYELYRDGKDTTQLKAALDAEAASMQQRFENADAALQQVFKSFPAPAPTESVAPAETAAPLPLPRPTPAALRRGRWPRRLACVHTPAGCPTGPRSPHDARPWPTRSAA